MNATSSLILGQAECTQKALGMTTVQYTNICTGATTTVPYGGLDIVIALVIAVLIAGTLGFLYHLYKIMK